MGLRRWLDPPEVIERKRRLRAAGVHPPRSRMEYGVMVPIGCMVPLAIAAAVLVGAGVLLGDRLRPATDLPAPDRVTVRVIDDGAAGGPKILSTQVVPLR